eukprot:scaffold21446_cov22-Tisochrysis_lutea.AAC.2
MYSQNCRRGSCQSGLPRAAACGTHGRPFEAACGGVGGGAGLAAHAQALGACMLAVRKEVSRRPGLGSSPVTLCLPCMCTRCVHIACCCAWAPLLVYETLIRGRARRQP